MALNSSPISAGLVSLCTLAAALTYWRVLSMPSASSFLRQAGVEQVLRLRNIALQLQAAGFGMAINGGEIHVTGDVAQAGQIKRVDQAVMAIVRHQGA